VKELTLDTPTTPLDAIGMVCARASFVAVLVGIIEGIVVSRVSDISVSGIGLATAGLWFPAALLFLLPASLLRRAPSIRAVITGLVIAFGVTLVFTRVAPSVPFALRVAPLEMVSALALAYLASLLNIDAPFRRPIAIFGIVLAVALQVYATYWVDGHRAFAGLLVEDTTVPRFMLKSVLRRFV
jgi:hypothetical protein